MDASSINSSTVETDGEGVRRRWYAARLFAALLGACGFGLELAQVISDFRAGGQARWVNHILLGVMFLLIAVVHSHLLLSKIHESQKD